MVSIIKSNKGEPTMYNLIKQLTYEISFHKHALEKYEKMIEDVKTIYDISIDIGLSSDKPNDFFEITTNHCACDAKQTKDDSNDVLYHQSYSFDENGTHEKEADIVDAKNKQIREWSRELIDLHKKINEYEQDNEKFENLVDLLTEAGYIVSIKNGDIQIDKE